ncbi:hypothetical protein MMC17_007409 [Xylographa soralifera]|nr:hypothetical protein [Xylographa soralifera]
MDEIAFADLKKLVAEAFSILWITKGSGEKPMRPELDLVTGFGGNARSENWSLNFAHLAVDSISSQSEVVEQIRKVYWKNMTMSAEECESEYVEKDGKLHVGRVVEAQKFNHALYTKTTRLQPLISTLGKKPSRALKLNLSAPRLLDTLHFIDGDLSDLPLTSDEAEIRPYAVSINFKDVLIALGNLTGSSLGIDCAGVVSRTGTDAGLQVGDTHLKEGESVLIHSGAGGVGQAANQLARIRKARIFTTVGTVEKKKLIADVYKIPETDTFSSRNTSFAKAILRLTDGTGVDVVFNSLSGENTRASWSCIAPLGRFIDG